MAFLRLLPLPVILHPEECSSLPMMLQHPEESDRIHQGAASVPPQFPSASAFLTGRELSCIWITVTIYIHCTRTISCFMDDFFLFLLRKRSMVLNQGLMPRLYPGVLGGRSWLSCYEGSTGIGIEAGEAGRHPTTLGSAPQHGVIQSKMLIVQLRHPVFNYKLPEG